MKVVKEKELLITVYYGTQTGNSKVCFYRIIVFKIMEVACIMLNLLDAPIVSLSWCYPFTSNYSSKRNYPISLGSIAILTRARLSKYPPFINDIKKFPGKYLRIQKRKV